MYLHNPSVPPMSIGRTSEDPLIQDSPVAPEPGFNDEVSGAQIVFGIARRVLLSEYSKIVFGRNERVRICNTSTTHTAIESIIFHESNLLTTFVT